MSGKLEVRKMGLDHYRVVGKDGTLGGKVFSDTFVSEDSWIDYSSYVAGKGVRIMSGTKVGKNCLIYAPNFTFSSCEFDEGANVDINESQLSFCNASAVGLSMGKNTVLNISSNPSLDRGETVITNLHMIRLRDNSKLNLIHRSKEPFSSIKIKHCVIGKHANLSLIINKNYMDLYGVSVDSKHTVSISNFGDIHIHNTRFRPDEKNNDWIFNIIGDNSRNRGKLLFAEDADIWKTGSWEVIDEVMDLNGKVE